MLTKKAKTLKEELENDKLRPKMHLKDRGRNKMQLEKNATSRPTELSLTLNERSDSAKGGKKLRNSSMNKGGPGSDDDYSLPNICSLHCPKLRKQSNERRNPALNLSDDRCNVDNFDEGSAERKIIYYCVSCEPIHIFIGTCEETGSERHRKSTSHGLDSQFVHTIEKQEDSSPFGVGITRPL